VSTTPVIVHILDKEYRVGCQDGEEDSLRASARYLDQRMRDIRDTGKVIGIDRIAVMAALNIAHELLEQQGQKQRVSQNINQRIRTLQERIESALTENNQLEV
jgi:cell division protein ZapA